MGQGQGIETRPKDVPSSALHSSSKKTKSSSKIRKTAKMKGVDPRERARAAIIGGFVADAASMPLHFIYDQLCLDQLLDGSHGNQHRDPDCAMSIAGSTTSSSTRTKSSQGSRHSTNSHCAPTGPANDDSTRMDTAGSAAVALVAASKPTVPIAKVSHEVFGRTDPEFFKQPSCPFYQYAVGRQSPYGDEAHVFLRMISTQGFFEADDCCEEAFRFLRAYMDKGGGRTNVVMRTFVERRTAGLDWKQCASDHDAQFFAVTKVPILVARYAGSPQLLDRVDGAVRMFQTSELALAACRLAARLLERVVLGDSVADTLRWAAAEGELPPVERSFLQVLAGVDGFGGVFLASGETAEEGGEEEGDDLDDAAEEYVDGDDDDDDGADQPVHGIVTNGDCDLIFAIMPDATKETAGDAVAVVGDCDGTPATGKAVLSAVLAAVWASDGAGDSLYDSADNDTRPFNLEPKKSSAAIPIDTSTDNNISASPASAESSTSPPTTGQQHSSGADPGSTLPPSSSPSSPSSSWTAAATTADTDKNPACVIGMGSGSGSNGAGRVPMMPFSVACEELGLSSQLPGSMQAALYALACFPSYKTAVRANIVAGGDNALRAWFIASLLAAEQGLEAIPADWIEKTLLYPQVETMATRLAGSNPHFEALSEKGCRLGVLLA